MCTVTVIPLRGGPGPAPHGRGFRLVTNRDEGRSRAAASPPRWGEVDGARGRVRAIYPVDPVGGGTWVAASERGLTLCLMNSTRVHPGVRQAGVEAWGREDGSAPTERGLISRGTIIPRAIGAYGLMGVLTAVRGMDLARFAPFRLLAVEPAFEGEWGGRVAVARWDRKELTVEERPLGPLCLVSSGLGDERVEPRLGLFREMVLGRDSGEWGDGGQGGAEAQDRFHRHRWEDRPEISVLMSRAEARTVSVTTVEMVWRRGQPLVAMGYEEVEDGARCVAVPGPAALAGN